MSGPWCPATAEETAAQPGSAVLEYVQSLRNKMDERQGNVHFQKDFKDCFVMVLTETWLSERDWDGDLLVNGFRTPHRQDHNAEVTGKTQGGRSVFTSTLDTVPL